ncbi:hypothetical protein [Paenibacillus sp. IHBB 3054]|uniref:hypothetical protein n=1 Tax=Paenibacillus sp. IHBB 3054 TaxID=3425689 RepID=UPI003F680118
MVEGALVVVIQERTCKDCGCVFQGGPRAFFCVECRAERKRQQKAEYQRRKRSGQVREIGSTDKCERCGEEYTVQGGNQQFCEDCQLVHRLEYDAETSLTFYHQNKEANNPIRNERRRIGNVTCVICGIEFDPKGTSRITCSDEHARQYKNEVWRKGYYRVRGGTPMPQGALRMTDISRATGIPYPTIKSRYHAGTLSEPDGFTRTGDPYWHKLPTMQNKKSPPTS